MGPNNNPPARSQSGLGNLLSDGLRIRGPHKTEYQLGEDWPRRGDAAGDVFRAIARDLTTGQEITVGLKVSKSKQIEGSLGAKAWDQEVRLLRRLTLLTHGSTASQKSITTSDAAIAEPTRGVRENGPYTIQLITEFGGVKTLPSMRFMVTTPVCWKNIEARIKAVEHGHMQRYSDSQALRWCWQIARGLWTLQEADICFSQLSLRNVLLTAPDGDIRLAGFDSLACEGPAGWDSRSSSWDLGRLFYMILSCSTDREDDKNFFSAGVLGGMTSTEAFLAPIPVPARPIILGLLSNKPCHAMPLGLALDQLAELTGSEFDHGHDRSNALRELEQSWWALAQTEDESKGGVHEQKISGDASPRETLSMMAQACLDLGREWEKRGKAYKALEYYRDAAQTIGIETRWKDRIVCEAWDRMADLHQGKGDHTSALAILKQLVELYEMNLRAASEAVVAEQPDENGLVSALTLQKKVEAAEGLANARVRLAASYRTVGESRQAIAHLNTAQAELEEAGADKGLAAVRVLIGKASFYSQRGEYVRALETYEDALERRRKAVSKTDPELACLLVSIAGVYAEKGDTDVALEMLIVAYKRMAEIYPEEVAASSDVAAPNGLVMAAALERIGNLFGKKGQWNDALMCFKAAHERKTASLPRAHPDVAQLLSQMAHAHEKKGDLRAAATMHGRALEIRRASLSPSAPEIAASLYGLGNAHQRLNAHKSALAAYQEAESIRRIYGPSIPLGDIMVNMSRPLKSLGKDGEAAEKLREAREIYRLAGLKPDDSRIMTASENLNVLGAQGLQVAVGNKTLPPTERRERPLNHHAAKTSSNPPSAPLAKAKSRGAQQGKKGCSMQ